MARALAALVIAALVLLATMTAPEPAPPPPPCMDEMTREQVRTLAMAGIDQALRNQTTKLFEVWMRDPQGQPARVQAGMHNAISAYARSRADALIWMPPACPLPPSRPLGSSPAAP